MMLNPLNLFTEIITRNMFEACHYNWRNQKIPSADGSCLIILPPLCGLLASVSSSSLCNLLCSPSTSMVCLCSNPREVGDSVEGEFGDRIWGKRILWEIVFRDMRNGEGKRSERVMVIGMGIWDLGA